MLYKITALSISIVILIGSIIPGNVHAWTSQQDYVRDPGNIPRFANYSNPTLAPGDSGVLSFAIKNRYNDSIDQCILIIELYMVGTIDYSKNIIDVKNPPWVSNNAEKQKLTLSLNRIGQGVTLVQNFTIYTSADTDEGTYFARFNLSFIFQGYKYIMLSKGYFSEADWIYATKLSNRTGEEEVGIDMVYLYQKYGAIALIPDTAFTVRAPIPMWPFYLLIVLSIIFAVLALIFYLQEEHNKFPRLEKGLQKFTGKFYQSRRFFKKRTGKIRREV